MDPLVRRHAELLTKYSLALRPGETVLMRGNVEAVPLLRACYRSALELGAHPKAVIADDVLNEIRFGTALDEQLLYVHAMDRTAMESVDAVLGIGGALNSRTLAGIAPERMKVAARGSAELTGIFNRRVAEGKLKWSGTVHPTAGPAQEAGMSTAGYAEFVYRACRLNEDDPVAAWRAVETEQARVCEILNRKRQLRFESEGTDLTFATEGRTWVNCCGKNNMPDGEVFTGPVEDSVNGHISFSFPGIHSGREIEGIRLTFKDGNVTDATAEKGEELLHQLLDTDPGARRVGEIAVGTNRGIQRFTKHMLFDEKIGGTVHLALGRSIPESGGVNESAIHWDMLSDMRNGGRIQADGDLVYENGAFVV
jgi:aminopeptidase